MNIYTLTSDGRARFRQKKISADMGVTGMGGYEVLDYLYEQGRGTIEEIRKHTGLSYSQVNDKLDLFLHHGFIERLVDQ